MAVDAHVDQGGHRLPVIHVGLPKTGTKTLQWRLFAQHPEVFFLGRYEGGPFRGHRAHASCRDETVHALMREIAYDDVRDPDFGAARALLADVCTRIGIDPEVGRACVGDAHDNQRFSEGTVERLRRVAASPLAALRFRFGGAAARRALLGLNAMGAPEDRGPPYRPRIDAAWRARIVAATEAGSAYVADTYGLPIEPSPVIPEERGGRLPHGGGAGILVQPIEGCGFAEMEYLGMPEKQRVLQGGGGGLGEAGVQREPTQLIRRRHPTA